MRTIPTVAAFALIFSATAANAQEQTSTSSNTPLAVTGIAVAAAAVGGGLAVGALAGADENITSAEAAAVGLNGGAGIGMVGAGVLLFVAHSEAASRADRIQTGFDDAHAGNCAGSAVADVQCQAIDQERSSADLYLTMAPVMLTVGAVTSLLTYVVYDGLAESSDDSTVTVGLGVGPSGGSLHGRF